MALQCLCGRENNSENRYCGDCGRLLSEVEVEPDLQAKIRSVVANQLNRRSKDKNSVELEIAANAFEMARRWLITSFAIVVLVFALFGWNFHSFVKGTKETISQHQTEIEEYKNAVEIEKEKLLGKIEKLDSEIEGLSKKVKQQKFNIFVEQIGALRNEIASISQKVLGMESKFNGLESAVSHSLIAGLPVIQKDRNKTILKFKKYNQFLSGLGLSFAANIEIEVFKEMPKNKPGFLEKFIEIDKGTKTVKVAGFIYELIDPILNDYTKCNLMDLLKLTNSSTPVDGSILSGSLNERYNTIAALAAYYTCSYLDSPTIHLGRNTRLQLDQPPGNGDRIQAGLFSDEMKVTAYSLWGLREKIGSAAADRILANALIALSRQSQSFQLDAPFFFAQVLSSAQKYEGGKFVENVEPLVKKEPNTDRAK